MTELGAARRASMNAAASTVGVGGEKTLGCVTTRMKPASTRPGSATASSPASLSTSQVR